MEQFFTFQDLIAPLDRNDFLENYYRQKHIYLPGDADRFKSFFDWGRLNEFLSMPSLWTKKSFQLARNGQVIPPEVFCIQSKTREAEPAMRPDLEKVSNLMQHDASLAMSYVELLTPEMRSLTRTLETVLGAEATAAMFLSFSGVQGYGAHFDVQNVFALQISGTKVWRLYENVFPNAAMVKGADPYHRPEGEHAQRKGKVLEELEMTPGDVLYIPHGQYHEALASSAECMHISFGIEHLVTVNFLTELMEDLVAEPFYRDHLPRFDDAQAQKKFLSQLGNGLGSLLTRKDFAPQFEHFLKKHAFHRFWRMDMPNREVPVVYRVCWPSMKYAKGKVSPRAQKNARDHRLETAEAALLEAVYGRDFIFHREMAEIAAGQGADRAEPLIASLVESGILEAV